MVEHLTWAEVGDALDLVEQGDREGVVTVFLMYEGRALNERDLRGARKTVNLSSFCQHFRISRQTFAQWLHKYGNKEAG